MRYPNALSELARLDFPVDRETVIDRLGDIELEPTGSSKTESLADVLERVDDEQFNTFNELYVTVIASLDDDYIGRKYYDDRSSDPTYAEPLSF